MRARAPIEAVVVGGSSGALDALLTILPALPRQLAVPVTIVLHVPPHRSSALAEVLGRSCALQIKEAEDKEALAPGTIYVAPPDYHLLIERDRRLSLSVDPLVHFSRPSIDVLFDSAADAYGASLVGVLLTGANEDGAQGLARIRAGGGTAVVQSPETARSAVMPEAGIRAGADIVLPLAEIGPYLVGAVAHAGAP